MNKKQDFEALFLEKYELNKVDLEECGVAWTTLQSIADDHINRTSNLDSSAREIAHTLNMWPKVHSVSWRIKTPKSLLKKIIRKKKHILKLEALIANHDSSTPEPEHEEKAKELSQMEKWRLISPDNYHEIITDLVGVRALHIFVDDCVEVDTCIRENWDLADNEHVQIIGAADSFEHATSISNSVIRPHSSGYRSIHYIIDSRVKKKVLKCEIQVRTIFQEGWGEIDHSINYPENSEESDVRQFLMLFSATAANADEMGTFVQRLRVTLAEARKNDKILKDKHSAEIDALNQTIKSIDRKLKELQSEEGTEKAANSILNDMTALNESLAKTVIGTHQETNRSLKLALGNSIFNRSFLDWIAPTPQQTAANAAMERWRADDEKISKVMKSALGAFDLPNFKDIKK